jgi:hypothetical protein
VLLSVEFSGKVRLQHSLQMSWGVAHFLQERSLVGWHLLVGCGLLDWRGCDWPRMSVVGSPPLRQPMDGGSLKVAACTGMFVVSLDACGVSRCISVDGASHGGRCHVE